MSESESESERGRQRGGDIAFCESGSSSRAATESGAGASEGGEGLWRAQGELPEQLKAREILGVAQCGSCGRDFAYEPWVVRGREYFRPGLCEGCLGAARVEEARARESGLAAQRMARLRVGWERICPPLYRETDRGRLPEEFRVAIEGWRFGAEGVGFFGPAGRGKTRAAFELLRGQHFGGRRCAAVASTRLCEEAAEQFADAADRRHLARRRLDEYRRAEVLLVDDLGKGKMTDRAELEFFAILEERSSHGRPTIWTANATAAELRRMMSADRGDPIMRRLKEFSKVAAVREGRGPGA